MKKQASPYKKLCSETPMDPQRTYVIPLNQSHIQYHQFCPTFVQSNSAIPSHPSEAYINTASNIPQLSFGNMGQNTIFVPATFQVSNKNMAQMMVPYSGAPNVCFQGAGVPQNNSCIILMNQPTVIANQPTIISNQPITFNIQNNYNTVPPQYQQAPKIEYITNLYCPNSNNNIFTSDSWLN